MKRRDLIKRLEKAGFKKTAVEEVTMIYTKEDLRWRLFLDTEKSRKVLQKQL